MPVQVSRGRKKVNHLAAGLVSMERADMKFLAVTQPTASWLLTRRLDGAVSGNLEQLVSSVGLRTGVVIAGPLRLASSQDGAVIALWHSDYLDSGGAENWGFVALQGRHGVLESARVPETIKSALMVFDARLQNLLLNERLLVRNQGGGIFTSVLGVGINKKSASIAYVEGTTNAGRAIMFFGPAEEEGNLEKSLSSLVESADKGRRSIEALTQAASQLVTQVRRRPALSDPSLQNLRGELTRDLDRSTPPEVVSPILTEVFDEPLGTRTYEDWMRPDSALSDEKRLILDGDFIERQPLRVVGPAGSGKSLLMQLMSVRVAKHAVAAKAQCRVLYLVHNSGMMDSVRERLNVFWPERANYAPQVDILVLTLHEYCRGQLDIDVRNLIDIDAWQTRSYQRAVVADTLRHRCASLSKTQYPLLHLVPSKPDLLEALSQLVANEIGVVIKGYRLQDTPRAYVQSERPYSPLHAILLPAERQIIFDAFQDYHAEVFEQSNLLDADDLALSMLAPMQTPVWGLRRKTEGFDYLFVDESQLYNQNERRVFHLLTKRSTGNLPIAIAVDEAQNLDSVAVSGFGALGIESLRNEQLTGVFRTTKVILRLAFYVIQRTTDLFGAEFPDYGQISRSMISEDRSKAHVPTLYRASKGQSVGDAVVDVVKLLRNRNIRRIAVVVFVGRYYADILGKLKSTDLPLSELVERGQRIEESHPSVVLSTPRLVGGREFEAVVCVGAEAGIYPMRLPNNDGLSAALEQQALRELYLSISRARHQVCFVIAAGVRPTAVIDNAMKEGLLVDAGQIK